MNTPNSICLVAGEASGDQLGAALIRAIRVHHPEIQFSGIGGALMSAEGFDCWWDYRELAVMGLFEVVRHLPRIFKIRRQLIKRVLDLKPDVYIGIDAPDFNFGVEKRLKQRAIPVIHYVSPTVWAWRSGRVKSIARATQRVLCLFPFEPDYYRDVAVQVDYTGHPMADQIPLHSDADAAREALGIETTEHCVALLPGSRAAEVGKLIGPMLEAAEILSQQNPDMIFLMPAANLAVRDMIESAVQQIPQLDCRVFTGKSTQVMAAADIVVCASGTATLEVMFINRPMVVCYRLSGATYALAKGLKLVKSRFFSLPNILASESLVPELIQDEVTGERIAQEVIRWLQHAGMRDKLKQRFEQMHRELRTDAAGTAAKAVLEHIMEPGSF